MSYKWYDKILRVACVVAMLLGYTPLLAPQMTYAATPKASAPSATGQISVEGPFGTAVNTATGGLSYVLNALLIHSDNPGGCGGVSLDATLTYAGDNADTLGTISGAYGWQIGTDVSYRKNEFTGDVTIIWDGGSEETYTYYRPQRSYSDSSRPVAVEQTNDSYLPPPGSQNTLTEPQRDHYLLTTAKGVKYYFDSPRHHHVTRVESRQGYAIDFSYNGDGRLTEMTDIYGRKLLFRYDSEGHLTQITDPNVTPNRPLNLSYDDDDNLISVTDPTGALTRYTYDPGHRLTSITDPRGHQLTIEYDAQGRVTALHTSLSSRTFSYSSREDGSLQCAVANVMGDQIKVVRYTYDERLRVTRIINGNSAVFITYDDNDHPISVTDETGQVTRYAYNSNGNITSITDPLGHTVHFSYHPDFKFITSATDALGRTTTVLYDEHGNAVRVTLPGNRVYTLTYDALGRRTSVTDPLGNTTSYAYDQFGNRSVITDATGAVTHFTYDAAGRLLAVTDPLGHTTTYTHDDAGRILTSTDPLGHVTTFSYDSSGNLVTVTNPDGTQRTYRYDDLNRLTQIAEELGSTLSYRYDGADNLRAVIDAYGHEVQYAYDQLGRLTGETDPLGNTTTFAYSLRGERTAITDPDGRTASFEYDAVGRHTDSHYPEEDVAYAYDAVGNTTAITATHVIVSYTYDDADRVIAARYTLRDLNITKQITYTYDAAGHRTAMTDPDGGLTTYTYYPNGLLHTITDPDGHTTTYTYDAARRMTRKDLPNGTYVTYTYDAANRVTAVSHYAADDSTITAITYTYDERGNRTARSVGGGEVVTYTYNTNNWLTSALYADGESYRYTYDLAGNRTQMIHNGQVTTYTYDAAGHLLHAGDVTYLWDGEGNLAARQTADGTTTYAFDSRGRLTQISDETTTELHYYPDGLLLSRDDGSDTTYYIYDGVNLLMELDDGGQTVARYTSSGVDEWLAMERDGHIYTYHADATFDTVALTDENGQVVERYRYAPFGDTTILDADGQPLTTSAAGNPFRFTGRRALDVDGLYYYRSRIYDPTVGRFLSEDPVGAARYPNRYFYALNNPQTFIDPFGFDVWVGIGSSGGGGFLVGYRTWTGWVMNTSTKERCFISTSCWSFGAQVFGEGGVEVTAFTGGSTGQDLEDSGWSGIVGVDAEVGAVGLSGEIGVSAEGAELSGSVQAGLATLAASVSTSGDASVSAGGSAGVGLTIARLERCSTSVYFCKKPPRQPPSPTKHTNPATKAGNDHQDDTHSVASAQPPLPGGTGLVLPAGPFLPAPPQENTDTLFRRLPRIALLWNGFAEEAAAFLTALGEPYDPIAPDFSPLAASAYPVLLIPSGGLFGLGDNASLRARLETYVRNGGVLLVSTQQHGADFAPVPGGLTAIGWDEDSSCFRASAYFPQYDQALSGFDHPSINALVDGYLVTYPADTVPLLTRAKTGYPAAIRYPYGAGHVVATTLYADWGSSNYQHTRDDHRVWRDLLNWATLGALPGYDHAFPTDVRPGETANITVTLRNESGQDAAQVRLILLDPDKTVVEQRTVTQTLPTGQETTLPAAFTAGDELGIWAVDYILLDGDGNAVQDQAIGAAFVVSDPPEAIGPNSPWSFWITSPNITWVRGSTGEWTFHVRNNTDAPRGPASVEYLFWHHNAEVRDSNFDYGTQTRDLGTVAAGQEVTFTVTAPVHVPDRLTGQLHDGYIIRHTDFQIRTSRSLVEAEVQPAETSYDAGETVTATVSLVNRAATGYTGTLRLECRAPDGDIIATREQEFAFSARDEQRDYVLSFDLPITPTFGLHTLLAQVLRDGEVIGGGYASFDLPVPRLDVTIVPRQGYYLLGRDNSVTVTLANRSDTVIEDGFFTVTLAGPDGIPLWNAATPFTLTIGEATDFTYTVPFTTDLGIHIFDYRATMRGVRLLRDEKNVPAAYAVTLHTDKSRYQGGETMTATLNVENIGDFREPLTVRFLVPDAAFTQTRPITPDVGQTVTLSYTVPLPTSIPGGVHPITVSLTTSTGVTATRGFHYIILPPELRVSLGDGPYRVGDALPVIIANIGGGFTDYGAVAILRDDTGKLVALDTDIGGLGSGEEHTFAFPVPADLKDGLYSLRVYANPYAITGGNVTYERIIAVEGQRVTLHVATEEPVYRSGDPITATVTLTNSGDFAVNDGLVEVQALSMAGRGPLAGVVLDSDGRPLPGAEVTLDGAQTYRTNLAGEFRFENVGVGDHEFTVVRAGYSDLHTTRFVVGPQEPLTLTLYHLAATLSGTVRTQAGLIVPGADVWLGSGPVEVQPPHRPTLGNGNYRFDGLEPGTYVITVTAPGFAPYIATITLNAGENVHDVILSPLVVRDSSRSNSRPPGLAAPLFDAVGGVITQSTTWTSANSPYTLTADLIVTRGVTLTIEPGVVVKGASGAELLVWGHLEAVGTAAQPITFTSETDTGANQWGGLLFDGGTGNLEHVTVRYAGQSNSLNKHANITIKNVITGQVRIFGSTIRAVGGAYSVDHGLYIENGHVVVSDTLFSDNGNGTGDLALYTAGDSNVITIANCEFLNNAGYPISIQAGDLHGLKSGNVFSNTNDTIVIRASLAEKPTIIRAVTLAPPDENGGIESYRLDGLVKVAAGVTLTLRPGTHLLLDGGDGLTVYGVLSALGTASRPITYTTGGSADGLVLDGAAARGDLAHFSVDYPYCSPGLHLTNGAQATLDHVSLKHSSCSGTYGYGLKVENGSATVTNSDLSENGQYGLFVTDGDVAITGTTFFTNRQAIGTGNGGHVSGADLEIAYNTYESAVAAWGDDSYIYLTRCDIHHNYAGLDSAGLSSPIVVHYSRIYSNTHRDAETGYNTPSVDARYNWWGRTPPSTTLIIGEVNYTPWLVTDTVAAGYFDPVRDVYEPNDDFAQATEIQPNTALRAYVEPLYDEDVYLVEVPQSGHLIARADSSDTRLALRLRLYDLDHTLLWGDDAPISGTIAFTQAVEPGAYYVVVQSVPDQGDRYGVFPYGLTVLLASAEDDLVATTTAEHGRTYDFGSRAVTLTVSGSATLTFAAPPSLTVPGGYYLRARLRNHTFAQVVAETQNTFFIGEAGQSLALSLQTDQDAYQPGQTVAVGGEVYNLGTSTVGPQTLTLAKNGVPFYTEQVTLGPGETHPFSATTTAPTSTGSFTITGDIGGSFVSAVLPVAEPQLEITLDAPDVVLPGDFVATLSLANTGLVPAAVTVAWEGRTYTPTVQPGTLVAYTQTLNLTGPYTITAIVTGDVTETVSHSVAFSAAPVLTLTIPDSLHAGDVLLPYQLANPGTEDLEVEILFTFGESDESLTTNLEGDESLTAGHRLPSLQNQGIAWLPGDTQHAPHGTRYAISEILPAGGFISDSLSVDLAHGLHPLTVTLRVDGDANPGLLDYTVGRAWESSQSHLLTVRAKYAAAITAQGAPTATLVVTGTGWYTFVGTLRVSGLRDGNPFARSETRVTLAPHENHTYTATLATDDLTRGEYDILAEALAENGDVVGSTTITGFQPGPRWVIVATPAQTTVRSNEFITLTYAVENQGESPDDAAFNVVMGDLLNASRTRRIGPGETATFTFTTYVPLDMPTMDIRALASITSTHDPAGDAAQTVIHVDGISLTVAAATDRATYFEGDPVTVTLSIANDGDRATGGLTALMAFNGLTRTLPFSLDVGESTALVFTYTATFQGDRKIFYGLYGEQSDRGAYLNTLYLYPRNLGATLTLDRQVYVLGSTAHATLVTTLTQGILNAYVFDRAYTLTLGSDTGFDFVIPVEAERGSHPVYYVVHDSGTEADGREQAVWFDVAAPWVRVIESHLGSGPYALGDVVSATLTLASDLPQTVQIAAWLLYPDSSTGAVGQQTVALEASLDNEVVITAVITDAQMGTYRFEYAVTPIAQLLSRFQAGTTVVATDEGTPEPIGAASLDVGPASLDRVSTDKSAYASESVPVALDIYSDRGGPAQVVFTPDSGRTMTRSCSLTPGYQVVNFTLPAGSFQGGSRVLTATLLMTGDDGSTYRASKSTAFDYATDLPDLVAFTPSVSGAGIATRTLSTLVRNVGGSGTQSATVRFYDGVPPRDGTIIIGGSLIGQVQLGAMAADDEKTASLTWDITGQGGEHTIFVSVSDGPEFSYDNNTAQADLTLPRLDASLNAAPPSLAAGQTVTFSVTLRNLQAAAFLPLTATLSARAPGGSEVFSRTWHITLNGGETRFLSDSWTATTDAPVGDYALSLAAQAPYESLSRQTSFSLGQGIRTIYLPLILRNH